MRDVTMGSNARKHEGSPPVASVHFYMKEPDPWESQRDLSRNNTQALGSQEHEGLMRAKGSL